MDEDELLLALLEISPSSSTESSNDYDEENIILLLLAQPTSELFENRCRFDKNNLSYTLFFKTFRFYKEDVE